MLKNSLVKYIFMSLVLVLICSLVTVDLLRVKNSFAKSMGLPAPTEVIHASGEFSLPMLKGMKLDPNDPLNIEFLVDCADKKDISQEESQRLINYFLAALTMPKDDLWVNLSPYEKDRIISDELAFTDMGRDLLAQDYLLKQLSSSLTHPKTLLGENYWNQYNKSIHVEDTFNKVWITPDRMEVNEQAGLVLVSKASLKVQTEKDYLATKINKSVPDREPSTSDAYATIVAELTNEVNEGKHFAKLRQIYYSTILAQWFKQKFMNTFYKQYIDQKIVSGIDTESVEIREKIWSLYCQSFNKGTYNVSRKLGENKRQQFSSGGVVLTGDGIKENKGISSPLINKIFSGPKKILKPLFKVDKKRQVLGFARNLAALGMIVGGFALYFLSVDLYRTSKELYQIEKYQEIKKTMSDKVFEQEEIIDLANAIGGGIRLDDTLKAFVYEKAFMPNFTQVDDLLNRFPGSEKEKAYNVIFTAADVVKNGEYSMFNDDVEDIILKLSQNDSLTFNYYCYKNPQKVYPVLKDLLNSNYSEIKDDNPFYLLDKEDSSQQGAEERIKQYENLLDRILDILKERFADPSLSHDDYAKTYKMCHSRTRTIGQSLHLLNDTSMSYGALIGLMRFNEKYFLKHISESSYNVTQKLYSVSLKERSFKEQREYLYYCEKLIKQYVEYKQSYTEFEQYYQWRFLYEPYIERMLKSELVGLSSVETGQLIDSIFPESQYLENDNSDKYIEFFQLLHFRLPYLLKTDKLKDFFNIWAMPVFQDAVASYSLELKFTLAIDLLDILEMQNEKLSNAEQLTKILPDLLDCYNSVFGQEMFSPEKTVYIYSSSDKHFVKRAAALSDIAIKQGAEVYSTRDIDSLFDEISNSNIAPENTVVLIETHNFDTLGFSSNQGEHIALSRFADSLEVLSKSHGSLDGLIFKTSACYGEGLLSRLNNKLQQKGVGTNFTQIALQAKEFESRIDFEMLRVLRADSVGSESISVGDFFNAISTVDDVSGDDDKHYSQYNFPRIVNSRHPKYRFKVRDNKSTPNNKPQDKAGLPIQQGGIDLSISQDIATYSEFFKTNPWKNIEILSLEVGKIVKLELLSEEILNMVN